MKTKKIEKKRLVVDMDINLHCEIKKRAAARNISIKNYVEYAIIIRLNEEKKYD